MKSRIVAEVYPFLSVTTTKKNRLSSNCIIFHLQPLLSRWYCVNPFPNDTFQTLPNLKGLQMTIFNLIKWKKVLQKGRKHCGKRINYSLRAISLFPTVLSKDVLQAREKTKACLAKG